MEFLLRDLTMLDNRPPCLTEMTCELCSMICENPQDLRNWKDHLLLSLEIGFRHLDPRDWWVEDLYLTHTEHHRGLADVVFESKDSEAISDLLHAWTMVNPSLRLTRKLLKICAGHLVDLPSLVPFSSRLRLLIIRSLGLIGYEGFEEVGVEKCIRLLDHLHIDVEDVHRADEWTTLLLDIIQSPEGARCFSNQSWELLVEVVLSNRAPLAAYSPQVTASISEAREWDKLECWLGVVWMGLWPKADEMTEHLESVMVTLFRQRPDAVQKLTQWMERWRTPLYQDEFEVF